MAELKLGFAIFNPGAGNGDQAVSVSAEKHTGRIQRSITASVGTNEGAVTKQVVVNQAATLENVSIQETASVVKEGANVTISGTSNSTKLTFSLTPDATNPLNIELPATYMAGGVETANGAEVANDPGADNAYEYSITLTVPENVTVEALIATLVVTDAAGNTDSTVITQTAGDPALEIDKEVINLDVEGTAQTLQVTSNTDWTISQVVAAAFRLR